MRFDAILVADWSARSSPSPATPSPNAIWIAEIGAAGASETYHRTRHDAEAALTARLEHARAAG